MKQLITTGIILARVNFGEADRVLTVLTPDYGKLHLMAKGVRRIQSKLAGGIELFSISNITFIYGRGSIGTLISSRLIQHYGHIVNDIKRVQLGYDLIGLLNKITEDNISAEYFDLLKETFLALDDLTIIEDLVRTWFYAQLLRIGGHNPNLHTNRIGQKLETTKTYGFNFENMTFVPQEGKQFTVNHIKFLRLVFGRDKLSRLQTVNDLPKLLTVCSPIIQTMLNNIVQV
ncbi:MAG: DNA repair protein RecO [Candidatus Saccharimonadales bacterium]